MAGLFISYARVDGATLARRLEQDLAAHGHQPWLDRAEIEVSESWSAEIESAIDDCEALIAVLTAGAAASRVCRGEQLRALRKGKRVVPLLAQADADRPVYLEPEHYLSFAEGDPYETRFAELLDYLAQAKGVVLTDLPQRVQQRLTDSTPARAVMAALREARPTWAQMLQVVGAQRDRFMEGLAGRAGSWGVFEPALVVPRVLEEAELARFIAGDARGLLLIGEPGVGKTNLLCHWCAELAAAQHAVLMYACERLAHTQVEAEIAKDVGLLAVEALVYLDSLAAQAGRHVVIVFDGLNDYRGLEPDGQRALLTSIDALVAGVTGTRIRVVVSCTSATWNRLDRQSPLRLAWPRYQRAAQGDADFVPLVKFSTEEAEAAYPLYRSHFGMAPALDDLPPAFRQRLREPVLLRLLAETLRNGAVAADATAASGIDAMVFRRYFEDRVRSRDDQRFVDELAAEMLAQRRAALPVQPLAAHAVLGPVILQEGGDNSYARLLDDGVLTEVRGDLFTDDLVKFSYPLVGAYAIVRRLMREQRAVIDVVRELAALATDLPLAWEAAVTLLSVRGDADSCALLASAPDPEWRELAQEGLVRMHAVDAARTRDVLGRLLDSSDALQQRCALRAAFNIGPAARDLLVRGALSDSELLRHAVRDTLYLIWNGAAQNSGDARTSAGYFIWRHAPDFTHGVMRDLVEQLSWTSPIEAGRILTFVLDLTITIYVNHCDRADVVQNTAELFHHLAVDRLHLNSLPAGSVLERIVFKVVSSVFADRLLRWMLGGADADADTETAAFFARPAAERQVLVQASALLDPASDLPAARGLLLGMLRSDLNVVRGTAALVLAVHAQARPEATESLLRDLFGELGATGRLWLLAGLSVLMPATPPTWVPLLEDLTQRLQFEHTAAEVPPLAPGFDALFVPLGLAYGKRKAGMPLFERWLAASAREPERTARLVAGLGPVGFYYPRVVLSTLRPCFAALAAQPATRTALVDALATMRSLHFDPVDAFLSDAGADEALCRDVAAAVDMDRVQQFMRLLGYYNNAHHFCVNYPRMRCGLAASALQLLAESGSAADFITGYAQAAIGMAREAGFVLTEWTRPEAHDAGG